MHRHLLAIAGFGLLAGVLMAADKVETYPSGKVKAKYAVDANGKKNGAYTEYGEDGKIAVTAVYRDDKLNGWRATYEKGKEVGAKLYKDDECVMAHSLAETKKALADILRAPPAAKKDSALVVAREAGLRQLKAYRYLCEVPWENLELDEEMTKCAQAAAELLDKVGQLTHDPKNPGLPQEQYETGLKGCRNGNLNLLHRTLPRTVDMWIDDSDPPNIERVGHRRWCLNPALQKTGLGMTSKFAAMWSMDTSQKNVPDYDFVCFPPRGFLPVSMFQTDVSWSISLNPKKYKAPDASARVKLYRADAKYQPIGKPLDLALSKINLDGFGIPNCIVFMPKEKTAVGNRYWVDVEGVKDMADKPAAVHYATELIKLP
jgi:hypothetical protein